MSDSVKQSLPELLSPAGTFEKLPYALRFGADAVYLSGQSFGMRSAAGNFSQEEMCLAFEMVHREGKRVYVTLNTMPRDTEFTALSSYLEFLSENAPDGVIVSDLGVLSLCKKILPAVPIHISTQASTVNAEACRTWYELGAKRIVLARELTLNEIKHIRENVPDELELEVFVHGSMCVSYSGRCLLSNYFTGRDANRGACTQPCRWSYHFTEDSRPDEVLSIEEHTEGSFIFGSKDLCMIDHIRELRDSGIDCLKIEGRMKSAYYCAVVTNVYRLALDALKNNTTQSTEELWKELSKVSHRAYDTGFFFDTNKDSPHIVSNNGYDAENSFLAEVMEKISDHCYLCEQKNKFAAGDPVEVLTPGSTGQPIQVLSMLDENYNLIENCPHPKMRFIITTDREITAGDLLRKP